VAYAQCHRPQTAPARMRLGTSSSHITVTRKSSGSSVQSGKTSATADSMGGGARKANWGICVVWVGLGQSYYKPWRVRFGSIFDSNTWLVRWSPLSREGERSTAGTPQPAAARPGRQGAAVPRLPPRASRLLRSPGSPLTSARRPAAGRRPSTSR
jgi:hypothetical protein